MYTSAKIIPLRLNFIHYHPLKLPKVVFAGGTLYLHLPAENPRAMPHYDQTGAPHRHMVTIEPNTRLDEIYGAPDTGRAIEDALAFGAFRCEYITHLLEARARKLPEASPLQLTRRQDLLELDIAQPDLSLYELSHHENKARKK